MTITIKRVENGFTAVVNGADGSVVWETNAPLSESELMATLRDEGEDQRDIITALHASDPWYFDVGKV